MDKNIQDMQDLIKITKAISNTYGELCYLEKCGSKESEEYTKLINKLKILLASETEIYQRIDLQFLLNNIYNKINMFEEDKLVSELFEIYCGNLNASIQRRIFKKVVAKASIEGNNSERLANSARVLEAFKKDLIDALLVILNEYIYTIEDNNIREYLINLKYLFAFTYSSCENDLIANRFNINSNSYITHESLANSLAMSSEELEKMIMTEVLNIMVNFVAYFNELSNEEKDESQKEYFSTLCLIFIRSANLFLSDLGKKQFERIYHISEYDYLSDDICTCDHERLIMALKKCETDKERIIKIDFKLKN